LFFNCTGLSPYLGIFQNYVAKKLFLVFRYLWCEREKLYKE